jgi:hypothetical protein
MSPIGKNHSIPAHASFHQASHPIGPRSWMQLTVLTSNCDTFHAQVAPKDAGLPSEFLLLEAQQDQEPAVEERSTLAERPLRQFQEAD